MPLKPTVFSVKFMLEKTKINKKEAGVGPFFKKQVHKVTVERLYDVG